MSDVATVLELTRRGWHVFPVDSPELPRCVGVGRGHDAATCTDRGKHPAVSWAAQASADPQVVVTHFAGTATRNVGIACGPSHLLVIDEDTPGGFAKFAESLGQTTPETYTVTTGRGTHHYFDASKYPDLGNKAGALADYGCDVRGSGGYVVGAGSLHASGALYTVAHDVEPALVPDWLVDALTQPTRTAEPRVDVDAFGIGLDTVPEVLRVGQRHNWLVSYACSLRGRGVPSSEALLLFEQVWRRCEQPPGDPLDRQQALDTLRDCYQRYPVGKTYAEPLSALPTVGCLDDDFWSARDELQVIREWARARMASPLAVLGCVLARVVASVDGAVVLPPLVGGPVSLNLFLALVGTSGSGKGAAERAASSAVRVLDGLDFDEVGAGSGEGIAHLFVHREQGKDVQHAYSVLMSVAEIDTLGALAQRQSSTLLPELRKVWEGERLGFAYVDAAKRVRLRRHAYRLCLVVGVQPGRAGALLDDADGGTPQRFVWLPTTDPDAPDHAAAAPPPLDWHRPDLPEFETWSNGLRIVEVCEQAQRTIRAARLSTLRGQAGGLESHALLCRLKVAAALGLLAGRCGVDEEDWRLAGELMRSSDATRERVVETLRARQREQNVARGHAEAERDVVRATRLDDERARRAGQAVTRRLTREDDWLAYGVLRRDINEALRPYIDEALERLVDAGQVEVEQVEYHGQRGTRVRLSERVR